MVINRQQSVRVARAPLKAFLGRVCRLFGLPTEAVTLALVSSAQMAQWNRAYRGKAGPTDVLSFPGDGSADVAARAQQARQPLRRKPPLVDGYLGDIAIAPTIARRNAQRFNRPLDEELQVLVLHGVLHLLGYDHETDHGQMARIESRLRRRLGLG